MDCGVKHKMGFIREDGLAFWEYSKIHKGGERWVTQEKLDQIRKRKAELARLRSTPEKKKKASESRREKYRSDPAYRNKILEASKIYLANRILTPEQKSKIAKRTREKRLSDPTRILKHRLRCYLGKILRNQVRAKTEEMIGCSFEQFKIHIENNFDIGMNWENRNLWHIDHITPLNIAKTTKEIEKLFHYSNLRPLWAKENLSKGAKVKNGNTKLNQSRSRVG
jgi:hypothetical protein